MNRIWVYSICACLCVGLGSCGKTGPVELTDEGMGASEGVDIENAPSTQEPLDPDATDSTVGCIAAVPGVDGELVIVGTSYDGPDTHREISMARASLANRASPIIVPNTADTVGYHTVDLGSVMIDNIPLQRVVSLFTDARLPSPDTIGPHYTLIDRDGVGGRGFQYTEKHAYQWSFSGSPAVGSFDTTITSPPALSIVAPTPRDVISRARNLIIRWMGGGASVSIAICNAGVPQHPLLRLKVRRNTGRALIARKILQLLPTNQSQFLFAVTSESRVIVNDPGIGGVMAIRAITNHDLLLTLRP